MPIRIDPEAKKFLQELVDKAQGRLAFRVRMILLLEAGYAVAEVAEMARASEATVRKWLRRFLEAGVDGLRDLPRPGQPERLDSIQQEALLSRALYELPRDLLHWSIRTLAAEAQVTPHQIRKICRKAALDPQRFAKAKRLATSLAAAEGRPVLLCMARGAGALLIEHDVDPTSLNDPPLREVKKLRRGSLGRRRGGSVHSLADALQPRNFEDPASLSSWLGLLVQELRGLGLPVRRGHLLLSPPESVHRVVGVISSAITTVAFQTFDAWATAAEIFFRRIEESGKSSPPRETVLLLRQKAIDASVGASTVGDLEREPLFSWRLEASPDGSAHG